MSLECPSMKRLDEISYKEYNNLKEEKRFCVYCCAKPASMKKVTMKKDGLDDGFTCRKCGFKVYKPEASEVKKDLAHLRATYTTKQQIVIDCHKVLKSKKFSNAFKSDTQQRLEQTESDILDIQQEIKKID